MIEQVIESIESENKPIPSIQSTEKPVEETPEQINWKKFREERELDRKAKKEAEKIAHQKSQEAEAMKAALEAIVNKPTPRQQSYQEPEEEEVSQEKLIQRHVEQAIERKEKEYAERERQREIENLPAALNREFRDFNQVCTQSNIDYLEFHYPEVTAGFEHMPEGQKKWSCIYKAIKKFIPNSDSKKDQTRIEKNSNKPGAISVPGATQTSDSAPQKLDDKRRADNWSRMQRVMKGGK